MYSGDNDYYLNHDFHKTDNKHGALFFDERNDFETAESTNKVAIIYGHNMYDYSMFSNLNKFLVNRNYARQAATMTMETLFDTYEYKVFAVVLVNNDPADGPRFNYLRTTFYSDADFLGYIDEIRARSLYDYPVDVQADDELLVLSTCTAPSGAHFEDGRLAVIARKVRPGESSSVSTSSIVDNEDVIMPLAWYLNQGLAPHEYYDTGEIPNTTNPGCYRSRYH